MKSNFPVIKDREHVLLNSSTGTRGGIMTIKPPSYALAVTNPSDAGSAPPTVIPTQGGS